MALNIGSNIGASIALRSLRSSDRVLTDSLSKLASGTRVQSARHDAAALAIGSRLRAELKAIETVSVNAGQGISMLQIAEGAYQNTHNILTRMQSLAAQAGSSHLSATERSMLDTEYQALKDELDRLAGSTTFNGQQLMNSNIAWSYNGAVAPPSFSNYVRDFALYGITATTDASSLFVTNAGPGQIIMTFFQNGVSRNFTFLTGPYLTGGIVNQDITLNIYEYDLLTSTHNNVVAGSITLAAGADMTFASFFQNAFNVTSVSATTNTYKVSTGAINSGISANIFGISANNLGLGNSSLTSVTGANNAMIAARAAVDLVAKARSEIGAAQNRMQSAQMSNTTALENLEIARSAYIDLDVASEMAKFTSQKILTEAGIAMLSQANLTPKYLLKFFA